MRIRRQLVGMVLMSCSAKNPPAAPATGAVCKPRPIAITLAAAAELNNAAAADARPVQIRVYLLKQEDRLRTASFVDIWQDDRKTLGEDLVSVDEKTAYPGATFSVEVPSNPAAGFVALVALFREPQDQKWYVSYALPVPTHEGPCPTAPTRYSVRLEGLQIEASPGPEGAEHRSLN
jgi:type VI secretion system protein VasD